MTGGCIHEACRLTIRGERFFLKSAPRARGAMLDAEADGLAALAAGGTVRVPAVIGAGLHADTAWLLLEWLDLVPLDDSAAGQLGEALACLHLQPQEACGWHRDNYIGATLQHNGERADWPAFFRDRRLGYQLELAGSRGLLGRRVRQAADCVLAQIDVFFADGRPPPALLHGDLWGGNAARIRGGGPVVFDPAVYRGDPETDLAMTELFGGFPPAFREAYDARVPRRPGAAARCRLYQLYHVLNHLNLFGGSYAAQSERLIEGLAREI